MRAVFDHEISITTVLVPALNTRGFKLQDPATRADKNRLGSQNTAVLAASKSHGRLSLLGVDRETVDDLR